MNVLLALVVWIMSLTVPLVILFYVVKGAVKAALRENESESFAQTQILNALDRVGDRIVEALRQNTPGQATSTNKPNLGGAIPEEASLVGGSDARYGTCSACGQEQPTNRTVCFKCGAKFQ